MGGDLAAELLNAGLVTPRQVDNASQDGAHGSRLALALTRQGLDENALAGFFISKGFGPLLDKADFDRAQTATTQKLSASTAHALFVLPVRASAAGVIVAMADPTDRTAIRHLNETFPSGILPTVARVSELGEALERIYPGGVSRPPGKRHSDALELTRARRITQALPLVRPKERAQAKPEDAPVPKSVPIASPEQVPATPKPSYPALDTAPYLARIEQAMTRDQVIETACEAVADAARAACFVAIRKKVFRGWFGSGSGVTRDGIRSLWIPVDKACSLRDAVETPDPYSGGFGHTAADQLLRSALGGDGVSLSIVRVTVGEKTIGLLCAVDWHHGTGLLSQLAEATGEALRRVIATQKA